MKRFASFFTAIAVAFQATGAAFAASTLDYDTGSMTNVTFDYDDADRMIEMVDGTGTTTWDYWDDGQVKEMASPQGTVLYDYYATTGRLQYLTEVISGGTNIVTTYTYDDAGRTESIDKFGETTTFEYDEASRPEKMTYDTGAYALYTYDGRSRIKAVEHKNSSNTLLRKETNVYDPASRITSRYEGPASGGVTTTFTYDDVGQLLSETSSGYSASYTYDANGNRTNRTVNSVSETYMVDDSDKLTSVTWSSGGNNYAKEYSYHYSGRPTSIVFKTNGTPTTTRTFTWDKESRITALTDGTTSASYAYNGFTARTSKTVSGTSTTYKRAGASAVSPVVADITGGTTTNHLPGISSTTGGTSTFSHTGIKNGVLQTNSSQTNTGTKRYDAFGNVLNATGSWATQFSYGAPFGYQSGSEFGYQLLGHRYYDPSTGRFLSRDNIKDGRNWYSYCSNSPTSGADPAGLMTVTISGEEYEFTLETVAEGLETGLAAVFSKLSLGLWEGGPYAGKPGFETSGKLANGGLLALDLASCVGAVKGLLKAGKLVEEGIYVVMTTTGKLYVGQSGNISRRLVQHVANGFITPEAAEQAFRKAVSGGRRPFREAAEQQMMNDLRREGIPLANKRNAVAEKFWNDPRFNIR
jgi:RHS repeat-associated protein